MNQASQPQRKVLKQGKYLRLVTVNGYEFAERTNCVGVVAIVAVTGDERLVLTEQFRPPVGRVVIDLPAGLSGDEDDAVQADLLDSARRELLEETGFTAPKRRWKKLCDAPSSPGLTSEIVSYFQANPVTQEASGGGVAGEQITVHTPLMKSIDAWLKRQSRQGKLIDAKVYAGLGMCGFRASQPS